MGNPMHPNFALFNLHVNDAGVRAFALMDAYFPKLAASVRRAEKKGGGIMAILDRAPTPATAMFLGLVTAFVNENRLIA